MFQAKPRAASFRGRLSSGVACMEWAGFLECSEVWETFHKVGFCSFGGLWKRWYKDENG